MILIVEDEFLLRLDSTESVEQRTYIGTALFTAADAVCGPLRGSAIKYRPHLCG